MPATDNDSLIQGGPGDQAGPADDARDRGRAGSQQGRPQEQERRVERDAGQDAGRAASRDADRGAKRAPPPNDAGDERAISDMERRAGTPDERATTDWSHGEGEPK